MSKVVGISDAGSNVVFATLKREQRRLLQMCQRVSTDACDGEHTPGDHSLRRRYIVLKVVNAAGYNSCLKLAREGDTQCRGCVRNERLSKRFLDDLLKRGVFVRFQTLVFE